MVSNKPIVHIYKEINVGKYRAVKHYELMEVLNGDPLLSNKINISNNRNFALSKPDFWLKERQGNKWSKCLSGLFKTSLKTIYKGDLNYKKHLLVFKFCDNNSIVKIYYFKDFYTSDLEGVIHLIV